MSIVGELRALELIYEKTSYPELAYMFKHALTHDVAYESVLVAAAQVAAPASSAPRSKSCTRPDWPEHYEALAHHFDARAEELGARSPLSRISPPRSRSRRLRESRSRSITAERPSRLRNGWATGVAQRSACRRSHSRLGRLLPGLLSDFRASGDDAFRQASRAVTSSASQRACCSSRELRL